MRSSRSASRPRSKRSALRLSGHKIGGQRRAFPEEILVHLLDEEFLRLRRAQVEPVLIHEHLHVLHPEFPGFLRDVVVYFLPQRMAFERDFVQPFHLFLELHAEHFARAGTNRARNLIESAASATHMNRILPTVALCRPAPGLSQLTLTGPEKPLTAMTGWCNFHSKSLALNQASKGELH